MITNFIKTVDKYGITNPQDIVYENNGIQNTYAELKNDSDNLAAYLDQLHLPREKPILVYGNQKFQTIATFMGIVKSGHAYIPVDSHSPETRLHLIQEIAKPALVINVADPDIQFSNRTTINQKQLASIFKQNNNYQIDHEVKGNENYYIIFTSGTTGTPKGVQISHKNLLSYINWMLSSDFNLPKSPRCLAQPPYSFDLSVMDWGPTLAKGGTLVALDKETTDNFKELFQVLPKTKIQVWVSTPTFMDLCLLNPNFNEANLPELSHFLFCGEELTPKTAQTILQRFPKSHVFNTYGPTETTVAVSQEEITTQILKNYSRLPIGVPKSDTKFTIIDPQTGKELGKNQKGELIISGPSVSKGYINNSEKTASSFIAKNPRQYRTGDLCACDEHGRYLFFGRTDFQIKLHGYRIELEEVNVHLRHQPLVKQGAVVPVYDKNHKVKQLIAWVVPSKNVKDNELAATEEIKAGLKKEMLSYMVPQRIIYKTALPQTNSGKVDLVAIIKEVNHS